jgi:hypothetical protein
MRPPLRISDATSVLSSAGVKSATGNLSDYKRRMALAIRIIVMGANEVEI